MDAIEGQPWYRRWFGEEYLALYPHRDEREALRAVRLFREASELERGAAVLDLACGAGRHVAALRAAGFRTVGLDLSCALLSRARERLGGSGGLVRGDMRWLPFGPASFGAVTLFFTSFGYFEDRSDDLGTLREARRVCRAGGTLLLDYLNAPEVRRTLDPVDRRTVDGRQVTQRRRIEDGFVVKTIEFEGDEGSEPDVFRERVRLYEPAELEELVRGAGFRTRARYGDYEGGDHTPGSPRLILQAAAE